MVSSTDRKFGLGLGQGTECVLVLHLRLAGEHFEANPFQPRGRAGEIRVDQILVQSNGFETLRALVALQCRNTHLGEGLEQTFVDRLDEVLHGKFGSHAGRQLASPRQAFNAL